MRVHEFLIILFAIGLVSLQPGEGSLQCFKCDGEKCKEQELETETCGIPSTTTPTSASSSTSEAPSSSTSEAPSSSTSEVPGSSTSGAPGSSTSGDPGSSTSGAPDSSTSGAPDSSTPTTTTTTKPETQPPNPPTTTTTTKPETQPPNPPTTKTTTKPQTQPPNPPTNTTTTKPQTQPPNPPTTTTTTKPQTQPPNPPTNTTNTTKSENSFKDSGAINTDRKRRSVIDRFSRIQSVSENVTYHCYSITGNGTDSKGCTTEQDFCKDKKSCNLCETDKCNSATSTVVFTSTIFSLAIIVLFVR